MVSKQPTIETNEGPPNKHVRIVATVVPRPDSTYPIVIKPYKLDMTQFGEKIRDEIKFNLTNMSDTDVRPTMVAYPDRFMDVRLPDIIPAGKSAEGVVKLKKEILDKSFDKSITIQLDDEKQSRFTLPVKRQVRSTAAAASGAQVVTPSQGGH